MIAELSPIELGPVCLAANICHIGACCQGKRQRLIAAVQRIVDQREKTLREAVAAEIETLRPTTLTNAQDDLLDEAARIVRGGEARD